MKWSNNKNFYPTFTLISRDQHLVPSISTTSPEVQCGLVAIPSIQENIRDTNHSLDLSIHYILILLQMLHRADVWVWRQKDHTLAHNLLPLMVVCLSPVPIHIRQPTMMLWSWGTWGSMQKPLAQAEGPQWQSCGVMTSTLGVFFFFSHLQVSLLLG